MSHAEQDHSNSTDPIDPQRALEFVQRYVHRYPDAQRRSQETGVPPGELLDDWFYLQTVDTAEPVPDEKITQVEARAILGEDFCGKDELANLTSYLAKNGIKTETVWYQDEELYRSDIEFAKKNNEIAIFVPVHLTIGGTILPPTINNLNGIFTRLYAKSHAALMPDVNLWYRNERFAGTLRNELSATFFYLRKQPLETSDNAPAPVEKIVKAYERKLLQARVVKSKPRLPTATELVLANLVYRGIHGVDLLKTPALTSTKSDTNVPITYFTGPSDVGIKLERGLPTDIHPGKLIYAYR